MNLFSASISLRELSLFEIFLVMTFAEIVHLCVQSLTENICDGRNCWPRGLCRVIPKRIIFNVFGNGHTEVVLLGQIA